MFGYLQASFMRYARWRLMPVLDEQIHILYKLSDAFDDAGSDGKRPYGSVTSLVLNVKRLGRTGDQDVRRSCNTTKENAVIYRLQDKEKHNAVTSVDSHSMSPSMPRSSPTHTPTKRPSGECKVMMCEGAICSYRAMLFMTRHSDVAYGFLWIGITAIQASIFCSAVTEAAPRVDCGEKERDPANHPLIGNIHRRE